MSSNSKNPEEIFDTQMDFWFESEEAMGMVGIGGRSMSKGGFLIGFWEVGIGVGVGVECYGKTEENRAFALAGRVA